MGLKRMNGALLHFGTNMWQEGRKIDRLDFDYDVWKNVTGRMVERKLDCVLIDLGEGVNYPSHPELAVKGGWDPDKFRTELRRLRALGLEPLPKLNFSCGHNSWMGEYRRMVGTKRYYEVVHDLVKDVAEIFDTPRFMHIGYDEETAGNQRNFDMTVVRQGELWWHDLLDLVGAVEKNGMRAWMWSDYAWDHPDFVGRCPKSVLQSNWDYDDCVFGYDLEHMPKGKWSSVLELYMKLDKAGYDQVPCGSNWVSRTRKERNLGNDDNIAGIVGFCRSHVPADRIAGYLMATWEMTLKSGEEKLLKGIDLLADALAKA